MPNAPREPATRQAPATGFLAPQIKLLRNLMMLETGVPAREEVSLFSTHRRLWTLYCQNFLLSKIIICYCSS